MAVRVRPGQPHDGNPTGSTANTAVASEHPNPAANEVSVVTGRQPPSAPRFEFDRKSTPQKRGGKRSTPGSHALGAPVWLSLARRSANLTFLHVTRWCNPAGVFGPEATQHEVFEATALQAVEAVLGGQNGCIFEDGQTGAGKTHTMIGPDGGGSCGQQTGMLPRAASELFRQISRTDNDIATAMGGITASAVSAHEVRASFVEVYKEKAFDLLGDGVDSGRAACSALPVREDAASNFVVDGTTEVVVGSTASLLELVAKGAAKRATASTQVHSHSSRLHAVLTLAVERRWRDPYDPDPRRHCTQTARLMLVDLAGAETMARAHLGSIDDAGVGTNLGLLQLGRVIKALAAGAAGSSNGGTHVPFRDSTLTKLLKAGIGGGAVSWMIAAISPAFRDIEHTLAVLSYAVAARNIRSTPALAPICAHRDPDPMIGDVDDPDPVLDRDVFARCAGEEMDPLIIYVHGSGPRNSLMQWNRIAADVARHAAPARSYYDVAIDCPGYGQSPGSKQTIRSEPAELLTAVVKALGRRRSTCLVGSSQGACAVFNPVLGNPRLTRAIAVCHPVGHAPGRFAEQPTLLIFDTDDAGHPVAVGRRMRQVLSSSTYYEFARSTDGEWDARHMGSKISVLLAGAPNPGSTGRRDGRRNHKLPSLTRVAGGFNAWDNQNGDEWPPLAADFSHDANANPDGGDGGDTGDTTPAIWRTVLQPGSNRLRYQHIETGRWRVIRPTRGKIRIDPVTTTGHHHRRQRRHLEIGGRGRREIKASRGNSTTAAVRAQPLQF